MNGPGSAGLPPAVICSDPAHLRDAGATLVALGWSLRESFSLPEEPWDLGPRRWACWGVVDTADRAVAATWVVVRGCALVAAVSPESPRSFLADLARCSVLEQYAPDVDESGLDASERALLSALAEGLSVHRAAERLFLSTRTAQRRLASARRRLDVRTTREAVVAWTELRGDR